MRQDGIVQHILTRVEPDENGCWNSGWSIDKGYSRIWLDGRMHYVHRLMYEHHADRLDPELTIDHLCHNRRCCNPAHLEQVPLAVNGARGAERAKALGVVGGSEPGRNATAHCPNGHEYTERDRRPSGVKQCRRCENERRRAKYAADKEYRAQCYERVRRRRALNTA